MLKKLRSLFKGDAQANEAPNPEDLQLQPYEDEYIGPEQFLRMRAMRTTESDEVWHRMCFAFNARHGGQKDVPGGRY